MADRITYEPISSLPPTSLALPHPEDECSLAIINLWYRYLDEGNFKIQYKNFFSYPRELARSHSIKDANDLADAILELSNDPLGGKLLNSKGCEF